MWPGKRRGWVFALLSVYRMAPNERFGQSKCIAKTTPWVYNQLSHATSMRGTFIRTIQELILFLYILYFTVSKEILILEFCSTGSSSRAGTIGGCPAAALCGG